MLPIPFSKFIPSFFNRDNKLTAMSDKIDSNLSEWKNDILNLNNIIDPAIIDSVLLDDIGSYLNASILNTDSNRIKREKVSEAIKGHKNRGLWEDDAKPKIDSIAGGDSKIFRSTDSSDWILFGGESTEVNNYWGTIGVDGIDDEFGLDLIGAGDEIEVAGNIYIDVDNDSLTVDEIEQMKLSLIDVVPSYYRVFLGYIDVSDQFVVYSNGIIN